MNNLVNYSSSSEDEVSNKEDFDEPVAPLIKRKLKLPMLLPVESKKSRNTIESGEWHQNRIRSIPHAEGNWASHIFIECK